MSLIDSHCHLDGKPFAADRQAVIRRAREAGVDTLVAIGLQPAVELAEADENIYAVVGVHPHEAAQASGLEAAPLLSHPKVVAVGEIGLDYHYDFSPRDTQRAVFEGQLQLAAEANLPVVIHTREAWADTVAILKAHGPRRGIFHCFSGGPAEAEEALALGFHLSFSGIITFPKAEDIREAARLAPLDRLLVETDAPYLAPVPFRGKRNEPAYIVHTARRLAELRGVSFDEIAALTTANWKRLCLQGTGSEG
jgi:TatD DNase family protein